MTESNNEHLALWGGRFTSGPSAALAKLSKSTQFDWRLADDDIAGSRAHARALGRAGLLTDDELNRMEAALDELQRNVDNGTFAPIEDDEDEAPEPDEEYILTLCGDTVIFSSGLLAEALSRLDEREREMIYLSFFKRIPQHEIGRQYGRSRSTAGYHIRKALRQLQAEMEGMAYEK